MTRWSLISGVEPGRVELVDNKTGEEIAWSAVEVRE